MFAPSPFAFALFCLVECVKRAKLLDPDDENLLNDVFQPRNCCYIVGGIEITVIFLTVRSIFCSNFYTAGLFASSSFLLLHWIIPYCVFKFGFSRFDGKFQGFLGALKRREMCLFGNAHLNATDDDTPLMPLKKERRRSLEKLREHIKVFEIASAKLLLAVRPNSRQAKSISEFINEDLRMLSAEGGGISDDFLHICALRTCWQYLFLLRSEFLRLAICASSDASANLLVLFRIWVLSIRTIYTTSFSFGAFEQNIPLRTQPKNVSLGYGKAAILSPLESAIFQLEWTLENLRHFKQLPTGDSACKFARSLENVISIFGGPAVVQDKGYSIGIVPSVSINTDLPHAEETSMPQNIPEDSVNELQIFEMDTGRADLEYLDSETTSRNEDDGLFQPELVDNRPLLRELNSAISRRKDICIEREIAALAKLRKVPIQEISREELERREFIKVDEHERIEDKSPVRSNLDDKRTVPHESQKVETIVLSRGAFGGMPDANDLDAILRQRRNFPTALAMSTGETFGFESDSDGGGGDG